MNTVVFKKGDRYQIGKVIDVIFKITTPETGIIEIPEDQLFIKCASQKQAVKLAKKLNDKSVLVPGR